MPAEADEKSYVKGDSSGTVSFKAEVDESKLELTPARAPASSLAIACQHNDVSVKQEPHRTVPATVRVNANIGPLQHSKVPVLSTFGSEPGVVRVDTAATIESYDMTESGNFATESVRAADGVKQHSGSTQATSHDEQVGKELTDNDAVNKSKHQNDNSRSPDEDESFGGVAKGHTTIDVDNYRKYYNEKLVVAVAVEDDGDDDDENDEVDLPAAVQYDPDSVLQSREDSRRLRLFFTIAGILLLIGLCVGVGIGVNTLRL